MGGLVVIEAEFGLRFGRDAALGTNWEQKQLRTNGISRRRVFRHRQDFYISTN